MAIKKGWCGIGKTGIEPVTLTTQRWLANEPRCIPNEGKKDRGKFYFGGDFYVLDIVLYL
jgi:hypothetical protein